MVFRYFVFILYILGFTLPTYSQIQSLPYLDNQAGCFAATSANKYITDFKIKVDSFGSLELCNFNSDLFRILNVISIVERGQFQGGGLGGLVGGFIDPANYYSWTSQQIRSLHRATTDPLSISTNRGGVFTIQTAWSKLSTLGRVGNLIHEARHTAGFYHSDCKSGPYEGLTADGCDKDFNSGGAHAVEMEYLARVATQGINFHPVFKSMARLMAMARANFVFNKSPIKKREALLVQTTNGQYFLLDQGRWVNRTSIRLPIDGSSSVLKRASMGATLLTDSRAYAIDLYENLGAAESTIDTYSYFKFLLNSNFDVLDFEEFDIGPRRYVAWITHKNYFQLYDFNQGSWGKSRPLSFNFVRTSTGLPDGKQGYFLIDATGNIMSFDHRQGNFISIKTKWNANMKAVSHVNGQVYALMNDGKLYSLVNKQWIENHLPQGQNANQIVSVPLYNVFKVLE